MKNPRRTGATVALLGLVLGCGQKTPAESASQPTSTSGEMGTTANTAPTSTAADPSAMATTGAPASTAPETSTGTGTPAGTATPAAAPQDALTDDQIATVASLANNSEIEQAKLARARSKDQKVLQFAGMMIAHHGEAQRKQDALSLGSAESTLSRDMLVEGSETLRMLKEKTGVEFDRAYMQAQVQGHQKVLDAIEKQLLPNAKREDLKAHLTELRPRVKQHLEQAEETLAELAARQTPPVAQGNR